MASKANLVLVSEANTPEILDSATALADSIGDRRSSWSIQNLGTNTLYVLLGDGATTSVFHYALKAGSINDDGTGGSVGESDGVIYTGIITVAGTSPRYVVKETT